MTAANGYRVSMHARTARNRSAKSIASVKSMVDGYDKEVKESKKRISLLEVAEVERLCKEINYREELLQNSGKPKSYFKVPDLQASLRNKRQ